MQHPHLLRDQADGVAILTLNRPERRNAMSPEMIVRLADAWGELRDDPTVRVVLLEGSGDKAFCAGADLGRLIPLLTGSREVEDEWDERLMANRKLLSTALLRGFDLFKPVVVAVNGHALAGGTEILLGTDFRIASEEATFGLTEVRRGLIPAGGSLARLARQIPYTAAMKVILGGEPISAEEALRYGLVTETTPAREVGGRAREVAKAVAQGAPIALAKAKEAVIRSSGVPLDEAFRIENECAREVMATEDAREGPKAFMEKRKPEFKGR
ncbi:MAG: crotonase/enoyl-CoA hydratase family protein [Actinomycetia bacterium]|nr:crotonase/enoyl-CoA hydratase family protein [Actinomycetes bacterium]MCP5035119.1 crotonase/enoyl-CoA hydratase family protein [Actinomycetes bacterium]